MRKFRNFVCIDWSGQAVARPKGLAMAHCADGNAAPSLLRPERGWTRQGILDWLIDHASAKTDMLIGLDLSPGLPFVDAGAYFPGSPHSPTDAKGLWQLVDRHCSEEQHLSASSFSVHEDFRAHFRNQFPTETVTGEAFVGGSGRLRQAELRQRESGVNPVSCFNLVGAAQVGKSSLTGMRLLNQLQGKIPVWPFDKVPDQGPLIVEIYTSIAARAAGMPKGRSKIRDAATLDAMLSKLDSQTHARLARYDDHSTDALLTAAWLRKVAADPALWSPKHMNQRIARTEGWTFGAL